LVAACHQPVTVLFYRRPDHLRQVMERVREVKPAQLFGVSDGPKTNDPASLAGVEASRRIFREAIDWPCQWEIFERNNNLGSYLSVSRGLDWVFERVEETIILEDDTVPDPTFFRFASELLGKYRENPFVASISGDNYDSPAHWPGPETYRFTRYHHAWGWATWKRAWKHFDREEKLLPLLQDREWRKRQGLGRTEWAYWDRCFRHTYAKKLDAWDYRWTLSLWAHDMFCIVPRLNLVRNIGFDSLGTHTVDRDLADLSMHEARSMKFPLVHPQTGRPDAAMDARVFKNHFQKLEGRRNLWQKLRDRIFGKRVKPA
jgi:hypothetical protein